jgi:type I restriction enzyme S subunit
MRSTYKKLGPYIRDVVVRNTGGAEEGLLGLSVSKTFLPTKANTIGTNFANYKIVKCGQFSYTADTSRRGDKIAIALLDQWERAMVSPIYTVFEIVDEEQLLPEYLMMWFRRPEFDRYARFKSHGSVRELFGWNEMQDVELPIPPIHKQRQIVREYQTVVKQIRVNEHLNEKLEETIQAIYKQWFVNFETASKLPLGDLIEFNPKHTIIKGESTTYIEMADVSEDALNVKNTVERGFTAGSKFMNDDTLLARITPCLENGKTAFVNCLADKEIGFGSTEFIVMRSKGQVSPYWVYCAARESHFREYAISSMVGSSGRQRVHSEYLESYAVPAFSASDMQQFHNYAGPIFKRIKLLANKNKKLEVLRITLLGLLANRGSL